jgi:hypothetical protein
MDISPSDLGASYELFVAAELIRKGFDVFRNLSPNGPADLVVYKDDMLLRVQVKGRAAGFVPGPCEKTFDVLAIHHGGVTTYFVPKAIEHLFSGCKLKRRCGALTENNGPCSCAAYRANLCILHHRASERRWKAA